MSTHTKSKYNQKYAGAIKYDQTDRSSLLRSCMAHGLL